MLIKNEIIERYMKNRITLHGRTLYSRLMENLRKFDKITLNDDIFAHYETIDDRLEESSFYIPHHRISNMILK